MIKIRGTVVVIIALAATLCLLSGLGVVAADEPVDESDAKLRLRPLLLEHDGQAHTARLLVVVENTGEQPLDMAINDFRPERIVFTRIGQGSGQMKRVTEFAMSVHTAEEPAPTAASLPPGVVIGKAVTVRAPETFSPDDIVNEHTRVTLEIRLRVRPSPGEDWHDVTVTGAVANIVTSSKPE